MRLRFILFLPLVLIIYACASQGRPLKPVRPTPLPTELFSLIDPDPLQVTFAQIEANPTAYLGQLLRVQGRYVAIPALNCSPFQGPRLEWGLIADNLQMGARGYERVVALVPDGVPFTVDGVWRQYVGPSGCGKEPLARVVYYLDVADIVQPNPISRVFGDEISDVTPLLPTIAPEGTVGESEPAQPVPTLTPDTIIDIATLPPTNGDQAYPAPIPTLTASPSPVILPTNTPRLDPTTPARATVTPSTIDTSTPTATPLPVEATATPTAPNVATETSESETPASNVATNTPAPTPTLFSRGTPTGTSTTETATPTQTGTPPTATATLAVTPNGSATPTSDSSNITTSVPTPGGTLSPTETPDGYAGPTITPTNTPEGYPLAMTAQAP